jgi:hypothetical protein
LIQLPVTQGYHPCAISFSLNWLIPISIQRVLILPISGNKTFSWLHSYAASFVLSFTVAKLFEDVWDSLSPLSSLYTLFKSILIRLWAAPMHRNHSCQGYQWLSHWPMQWLFFCSSFASALSCTCPRQSLFLKTPLLLA